MQHAVTDGADLAHGGNHAEGRIRQGLDHKLDRLFVILHLNVDFIGLSPGHGMLKIAARDPNAVAHALGKQRLIRHVDQLVLNRRAAGVDHQNFHAVYSSSSS